MKRPLLSSDAVLALAGLSALAVGLALVSIPLALGVIGALLIAYSVMPQPGGTP